MSTLLDQLKAMTVVVADTGDIDSIEQFKPQDATTNPSLIQAAAAMPRYSELVERALSWASAQRPQGDAAQVVGLAIDRLAVDFGIEILKIIPGRVSTEVDARLSYDTQGTIDKARLIIQLYEQAGVSRERVLIKIASTWEGIEAARALEQEGIRCNMTLLFGLHQAIACAQAHATLISPFVGRILDWYKKETGRASYEPHEDPGVISVTQIFNYYKKFGYPTEIMGASFRNLGEVTELAGCDLLTISPALLRELQQASGPLPRKLDASLAAELDLEPLVVDHDTFKAMHAQDRMATEKLTEGIDKFSEALVALEQQLLARHLA